MTALLLVFLGGGIGSVLRYLTGLGAVALFGTGFPLGTLAVNVIGCLAMGIAARALPLPEIGVANARLLLMTGVLGGFTTFSAFALDAAGLWMRGETGLATLYVASSVGLSLVAVGVGLWIGGLLR